MWWYPKLLLSISHNHFVGKLESMFSLVWKRANIFSTEDDSKNMALDFHTLVPMYFKIKGFSSLNFFTFLYFNFMENQNLMVTVFFL